jgi:hypothetical protein
LTASLLLLVAGVACGSDADAEALVSSRASASSATSGTRGSERRKKKKDQGASKKKKKNKPHDAKDDNAAEERHTLTSGAVGHARSSVRRERERAREQLRQGRGGSAITSAAACVHAHHATKTGKQHPRQH